MYLQHLFEDSGYYFVLVKDGHARVVHEDAMTGDRPTIWVMEKQGWKIVWDSARSKEKGLEFAARWHDAIPEPKVTDSPAFRNWFGDSKVVDAHGEPLRVYHGTVRDVEQFKYIKPMGIGAAGWGFNRIGFWFDADPRTANVFAGGGNANVMPVYLSIRNPLVLQSRPVPAEALATLRQLRDTMYAAEAARNSPKARELANQGLSDGSEERFQRARQAYDAARKQIDSADPFQKMLDMLPKFDRKADPGDRKDNTAAVAQAQQKLIQQGYDGILLKGTLADGGSRNYDPSDWWIAFRPNQIKSAVGNRGNYNSEDDRVIEGSMGCPPR
jgi:hypothetical protein